MQHQLAEEKNFIAEEDSLCGFHHETEHVNRIYSQMLRNNKSISLHNSFSTLHFYLDGFNTQSVCPTKHTTETERAFSSSCNCY